MSSVVLKKNPVWKDGPWICQVTMLPAHESVKAAKAFCATQQGDTVERSWTCSACKKVHTSHKIGQPSGGSSGTGREQWPQKSIIAAMKLAVFETVK